MPVFIVISIVVSLAVFDMQQASPLADVPLWLCLSGVVIGQVCLLFSARHVVRSGLAELAGRFDKTEFDLRLRRRWALHQCIWLGNCLLTLICFQWPQIVAKFSSSRFLAHPVLLIPILLPVLTSWWWAYEIESELDSQVKSERRMHFVWRRVRAEMLVPVSVILGVLMWQDTVSVVPAFGQTICETPLRILPVFGVAVFFPTIIRRSWETKPLSEGPRRERLEKLCANLGLRFREILVWNTGGQIRNAAVTGFLPQWRYVLLSDRLLSDLDDKQVEAIFLHELAHVKKRHPLRLMCWALAVCVPSAVLVTRLFEQQVAWAVWTLAVLGIGVAVYLLSRLAKLFEMEADFWAGSRDPNVMPYLRAVAKVCGGDPDADTLLHPAFSKRCELLLAGPEQAQRWLRVRFRRTQCALLLWLACGALFGWTLPQPMNPQNRLSGVSPHVVAPR